MVRPAHRRTSRSLAAFAAAGCALTGAAAVALAVTVGPTPGLTGYVSEAGIAGSGHATLYRVGVFGLAAALLFFAAALPARSAPPVGSPVPARSALARSALARSALARSALARSALARSAAGLLVAAAVATAVSGAVTCTNGCPLPPFEVVTAADLVHGGASVVAVACCVFAMLALACSPDLTPAVRRLAVAGLAGAMPLSGAVGVAMLVVGRGMVVGVLERILLGLVVLWVATSAVRLGLSGQR